MRIAPLTTVWSERSTYFHDPRLEQLFRRYATCCGSSPFLAPATLMLVAHVEQDDVWLVNGGMQWIALALKALIEQRGGQVRRATTVERIELENGRARALRFQDGECIDASAMVFNDDMSALAEGLPGEPVAHAAPSIRRDPAPAVRDHLASRDAGARVPTGTSQRLLQRRQSPRIPRAVRRPTHARRPDGVRLRAGPPRTTHRRASQPRHRNASCASSTRPSMPTRAR